MDSKHNYFRIFTIATKFACNLVARSQVLLGLAVMNDMQMAASMAAGAHYNYDGRMNRQQSSGRRPHMNASGGLSPRSVT